MTASQHLADLADAFRPVLPDVPESVLLEVAGVASGLIAREIEKACRTPRSQQGPGRQQREDRRSA